MAEAVRKTVDDSGGGRFTCWKKPLARREQQQGSQAVAGH
jgi:hypothetical protein